MVWDDKAANRRCIWAGDCIKWLIAACTVSSESALGGDGTNGVSADGDIVSPCG